MAITRDVGRQHILSAFVEFTFATLETRSTDAAGGVQVAQAHLMFDIPPNTIILAGEIVVTTAFTASGVTTASVGDGSVVDRYMAAGTDIEPVGIDFLIRTGFKYTEWDTIDLFLTNDTANTAGAGYMQIQYVVAGRETENV